MPLAFNFSCGFDAKFFALKLTSKQVVSSHPTLAVWDASHLLAVRRNAYGFYSREI